MNLYIKKITVSLTALSIILCMFALPLALNAADFGANNTGTTNFGANNTGSQANFGKNNNGVTGIKNPIGAGDLQTFLKNILRIFVILGSMVVVFFIIYAGLQYVLARGDESAIKKAHQTLTWTIIGAAILLGAEAISLVISNTVQELAK